MTTLGDCPPCVCGCSRLAHICSCRHNCCRNCGCSEYLADDGTDGVDDYESPSMAALLATADAFEVKP